jgi:catechol 2,3-dioxygenase-like lactoylglutathione lyase family enzyme
MTETSVRYIVDDVDAAVDFYTTHLQFDVAMRPGPGFAMLRRGDLRLLLNSGQELADGSRPEPGGWNRFQLEVDDLEATVAGLSRAGVGFRGEVITGRGGRQALALDPSGNLVELFEPGGG